LIAQLRQRFNSVIAVSESKRQAAVFFGDRDIQMSLQKTGQTTKDEITLPDLIQDSYFTKMMQHNKEIAHAL
jgi:hypothetical protein